ncbi:MAG: alpha/beta fold hydrolase [Gaiellaceae bacterium]
MGGDGTMRLRDGRTLGYGSWGPEDGAPIFAFHGGGLCRLCHYGEEAPAAAGVRLVLPDRPGCGLSDEQPEGTHLDFVRDIEELADALGFARFSVFGVSAGGPPALACGFALPERVAAVGVVSGVGPFVDEPELDPFLPEERRRAVRLARRDPESALAQVREDCEALAAVLAENPAALIDESHERVFDDTEVRARFVAAFAAIGRRGPAGAIRDTWLNYGRPWGFRLDEIRVPVHVWHGACDPAVPVEAARLVASRVPGAALTVYPDEGHGVDYPHIDEILATLAALTPGRAGGRRQRNPRGPNPIRR